MSKGYRQKGIRRTDARFLTSSDILSPKKTTLGFICGRGANTEGWLS